MVSTGMAHEMAPDALQIVLRLSQLNMETMGDRPGRRVDRSIHPSIPQANKTAPYLCCESSGGL
jgi:hypothetical protein